MKAAAKGLLGLFFSRYITAIKINLCFAIFALFAVRNLRFKSQRYKFIFSYTLKKPQSIFYLKLTYGKKSLTKSGVKG